MNLHKSIIITAIGCLGAAVSGCSDWLDYTPSDKQTHEQQFSTPAGFHTSVNGVYNLMCTPSLYGYNLSYGPLDIMGNCYNVNATNTSLIEFNTATYTGDKASETFETIWSSAYNAILNTNLILEALDQYPGVLTANDEKLIRGEMLAMRAFLHLDLVRLFGQSIAYGPDELAVPYADTSDIIRRERLTTKDIIYNKIIPDLTNAQSLLKEVDPVLTEGVLNTNIDGTSNWSRYRQLRMNYYAATLVKARAYIWMEDFDNAMAEAVKITDDPHALSIFPWVEPSRLLANNTNPDRIFSTECLFGFYNDKLSEIFDYTFNGSLDTSAVLHPVNNYDALLFPNMGDYRRQSQWGSSVSILSNVDFIKYKGFKANVKNPEFWASFFGLIRISEAFLIAAECHQHNGDIPGAIRYLNPLKTARGIATLDENTSRSQVLKEIKLEYCRDMRGEGQIYFLHKRNWQTFTSASGNSDLDGSGQCSRSDTPSAVARYSVPIPASENF
ncbi:RagB/SusD family nutrient uptake outer membrane protein [Duncaniella freteri]|jgi:hypothetical protein|uniref:RagB/SusD family nutrient uptake outer membrane protein n=1 Tax=Duncaniella freteri TaxID=2530391 RepID=UPI00136A73E8|nr:RagB/SusD family nutrient uptake outer membrane protein [Duncaniella freteri]NBJ08922.1 RagB/SusD family nutrient uptake outer membrane protein [Alistipes sp. Z76]NCE70926.1 RagB/SusD family nutrient uptake outer membrane protein [Muribaculaceae bacterium M3]